MLNLEDIKSILGTKINNYKIGTLYNVELGTLYLQAFKGRKEGILTYNILNLNDIELNNPVGFNNGAYLEFNSQDNKVETKYY